MWLITYQVEKYNILSFKDYSKKISLNSLIGNYFQVIRHLLNQSTNSTSNDNLLMRVWLPMAMILALCFSGCILSKIISPEKRVINTFEEMINSGLKVYTNNYSWIWWQFSHRNKYNAKLDYKLSMIEGQVDFSPIEQLRPVSLLFLKCLFSFFFLQGDYERSCERKGCYNYRFSDSHFFKVQ